MKPYYEHNGITIYHGDTWELLPQLRHGWCSRCSKIHFDGEHFDLLLTDPPYGIQRHQSGHKVVSRFDPIVGDDGPFNPRMMLGITQYAVIWGANHFADALPAESSWLMWLKHDPSLFGLRSTSPFELAWTNRGGAAKAFRFIWDGSIKQGECARTEHCHPTEKPVELMSWCLSHFPETKIVIDPFCGTGPSLKAAKDHGIKAIGIEIEEKYCEIAAKRLSQEVFQW